MLLTLLFVKHKPRFDATSPANYGYRLRSISDRPCNNFSPFSHIRASASVTIAALKDIAGRSPQYLTHLPRIETTMKHVSDNSVVYKRDNDYSLQLNRWFLKPIGAWPELSTHSLTKNVLINILRITCHSLIAFTVIPPILYIFFEEKDISLKLRAIGPTSHCLMGGINYCSLLYHSDRIRKSIEHMELDWRLAKKEHDRKMMLRNAKVGRIIAGVCALIMQGGVLCYNVIRGMSPIIVTIGNETITIGRLPCPSFNKIVDTRFSPVYEVVLVLQCLSLVVVNNVTVSACGLAAVFTMHACGQLNVVMSRLKELVDEKREVLQLKLTDIVERHLRALK